VSQIVVTVLLSLLGCIFSSQVAIATLSGGLICSLANFWFALVAFRPELGKQPSQMLAAFYIAEVGKFLITALLFLYVFKTMTFSKDPHNAFLIFVTYALVQSIVWVFPLARSKYSARQS
jgi:ATP synthase protein I